MDNDTADPIKSLVEARDAAFKSSGNLNLTKNERKEYSDKAEELAALIEQFAEQKIDVASATLTKQSELKNVTSDITSASKEIDWAHPHAQSANANLGHLSKVIDSGKKFLSLFKRSDG